MYTLKYLQWFSLVIELQLILLFSFLFNNIFRFSIVAMGVMFFVLSLSVMSDSFQNHGLQPARLLCPWGFSRQEYWSGQPFPSQGDLPDPGIKPRSPTLQVDSLPSEPPEKPKNTGVGILSLLQGIFLSQELTQGLLHCRRILYQLSHQ